MRESLTSERTIDAVPLYTVTTADYETWKARQEPPQQQWLEAVGFSAKPGSFALLPGAEHNLAGVAVGAAQTDPWWLAETAGQATAGRLLPGRSRADRRADRRRANRRTGGTRLGAGLLSLQPL